LKYERQEGKEISHEAQVAYQKTTPNQKAEYAKIADQSEARERHDAWLINFCLISSGLTDHSCG
jgi:hypothetical protein